MTVSGKFRKVKSKNCILSDSVIFVNPNEVVHVLSTLEIAGKISLSTPNSMSF
jgi:hypothetical protein